jgi:hypothetical protein
METAIVILLGIVVALGICIYRVTTRILENLELELENDNVE